MISLLQAPALALHVAVSVYHPIVTNNNLNLEKDFGNPRLRQKLELSSPGASRVKISTKLTR
jgi:hypothetical protein